MATVRRFVCDDLFRFNNVNLDKLTETYHMPFYLQYLGTWPNLCQTVEASGGQIEGYILGKAEGLHENWHGHVTAVTVAPEYRRLGVASLLMEYLEHVSDEVDKGYFVDLYVRASNAVAIDFYARRGYVKYRQVIGYYAGEEDAFDMRKALSRDPEKKSEVPLPHPVYPSAGD